MDDGMLAGSSLRMRWTKSVDGVAGQRLRDGAVVVAGESGAQRLNLDSARKRGRSRACGCRQNQEWMLYLASHGRMELNSWFG